MAKTSQCTVNCIQLCLHNKAPIELWKAGRDHTLQTTSWSCGSLRTHEDIAREAYVNSSTWKPGIKESFKSSVHTLKASWQSHEDHGVTLDLDSTWTFSGKNWQSYHILGQQNVSWTIKILFKVRTTCLKWQSLCFLQASQSGNLLTLWSCVDIVGYV